MALSERIDQAFTNWALRGRPPEPTPIILTQRRVFVLPTRAGLAYFVALVVMLIGAINYTLNLGYALVFLLGGLGVATILNTFRNLAHLHITTGRCEPVFAGEAARFGLVLHNLRNTERLSLRLWAQKHASVSVDVPPLDTFEAALPVTARQRGWLMLPRVTLETTFPLGLVRAWSYAAPAQRCLVYPAPALEAPPLPTGSGEQRGSRRQGSGNDDFAGLRDHQFSDPPRHVAWKVVARQNNDTLLTKLFAGENTQSLWLDWHALPITLDVEARLSLLARWVCDAHAASLSYGLRLPQRTVNPGSGDSHFHQCLQALALHGLARADAVPPGAALSLETPSDPERSGSKEIHKQGQVRSGAP